MMQLITLGLQYAIDVVVLLLLLPNTEIQGWCCPLKISADYTHYPTKVFSFFFYDWLLTLSWTLQKQLVLFPAKQCQELFSKTSGAPKKSISIQKESSLVQNSINYPFDLTLDLKHDSSLKTKRRKMHVKWLLLLRHCSHRCTNGGVGV